MLAWNQVEPALFNLAAEIPRIRMQPLGERIVTIEQIENCDGRRRDDWCNGIREQVRARALP